MPRAIAGLKRDHYQIRYQDENGTQWGVVSMFDSDKDSREIAAKGNVLVAHAVFPRSAIVAESQVVDLPMNDYSKGKYNDLVGHFWGGGEYDDYVALEYLYHQMLEAQNPDDDKLHVNDLFGTHVGDGTAHYVITKINPKTVAVEWRGFCADRWTDRMFGWGGNFRKQDVARFAGGKSIRDIFNKNRPKPDLVAIFRQFRDEFCKTYEGTALPAYMMKV